MDTIVTLYHGSPEVIVAPLFGAGNPHNDFGLGFYCSESVELAKEWSSRGQELGVDIDTIIAMYHPYHEADITKFSEDARALMDRKEKSLPSRLSVLRKASGMTQEEPDATDVVFIYDEVPAKNVIFAL